MLNPWALAVAARMAGLLKESEVLNRTILHNGLRGAVRELFVRSFLVPFLPPEIGIGTGEVINHTGRRSRQVDVVLYNRRRVPPFLVSGGEIGLFPWESVVALIEVKSTASAATYRDALVNSSSVRTVVEETPERDVFIGKWKAPEHATAFTPIPYLLFCFSTDLSNPARGGDCKRVEEAADDCENKYKAFRALVELEKDGDLSEADKKIKKDLLPYSDYEYGGRIHSLCIPFREWATQDFSYEFKDITGFSAPFLIGEPNGCLNPKLSFEAADYSSGGESLPLEAVLLLRKIIEYADRMPVAREHYSIERYLDGMF